MLSVAKLAAVRIGAAPAPLARRNAAAAGISALLARRLAHTVIVGAGVGGIPAAYDLRAELGPSHEITIVDPRTAFQFTPSNPWVAVGWRTKEQVSVPFEQTRFKGKNIKMINATATKIDPKAQTVATSSGDVLKYDYLIIATGPKLAFDEVPGLGPQGHTVSVCTTEHALHAWDQYQQFVKDPGPIVVGAAAGASCFGPAYEFAMIVDSDLKKRGIRNKVPITFVTSEPYVGHLGLGGVGDSKGLLESEFRKRHIAWVTNAKVAKVEEGKMTVLTYDDAGKETGTKEVPFKYSMILPAFKGVDAVADVKEICNPRGFVVIDKHQRNPKYPNIYSLGVCVAIPPVEVTPVATGAPKTGYMIESMVTATAHNIASDIAGKEVKAEATWGALCLADAGDRGIGFIAAPQIPPRNVTVVKEGAWVHLAKVAFEKYFIQKVKMGLMEPWVEGQMLRWFGLTRLTDKSR